MDLNGWRMTRLGDIAIKIGSGLTPKGGSASYQSSGIPLIRSQNVLWGQLSLDDVAYIDDVQHANMANTCVKPRDVLLNITGASIGRACLAPDDLDTANVNQHVCIIRPHHDQLNPLFLLNIILSDIGQRQIERFQAGGNRQGLNFQQIRSFTFPLPPIGEQDRIAAILSTWDRAIETVTKQRDKLTLEKKALMQQLLTGKRRVRVPSVAEHGTMSCI